MPYEKKPCYEKPVATKTKLSSNKMQQTLPLR